MHFYIKSLLVLLISGCMVTSCNSNKNPDVSNIKIDLKTQRFERDFFSIDSNQVAAQLDGVIAKYPVFGENFLTTILNVDPRWTGDTAANYLKGFISAYRNVFDSSQKVFADFSTYETQLEQAFKYTRHYFPQYSLPNKIITYIGPMDGYGDILDADAVIIGLHQHLGKNFSMYSTPVVRETYPEYISARFTPEYIPVNTMKNIVTDLYPEKFEDKSLVVQMVEKGRRLFLLQKLLPDTKPQMLIGYTDKQWEGSLERQTVIWDLFVQNNYLQTTDYNITKNFIGEGPKTQELGEASPGNIGSFAGWQIVNKYMDKFPETKLTILMQMDAEEIFQKAKYKP
jgi:hypothetical protein